MSITLARLQRLAAQAAPVIGISRLDRVPFAFERARLAPLLEGLTSARTTLDDQGLRIDAGRRRYTLFSMPMMTTRGMNGVRPVLQQWAKAQRAKRAACGGHFPVTRDDKRKVELTRQIGIAQRKADKLKPRYRPYNANLDMGREACDYEHNAWVAWVAEKDYRRAIGQIAVRYGLHNGELVYVERKHVSKITRGRVSWLRNKVYGVGIVEARKMYKTLEAWTGHAPRKYGDLLDTARHSKVSQREYMRHLHLYAGGIGAVKPTRVFTYGRMKLDEREHGEIQRERVKRERLEYCQQMRDWRNAMERVNWLKSVLASYDQVDAPQGVEVQP